MAGAVIFLLSSRAPLEGIGRYFRRPVRIAPVLSETEFETGALSAPIYPDLRSICDGDFYDQFALVSIPGPEFCFVGAVLGDVDEELWKDALVLGVFGHDLDVFVDSFRSKRWVSLRS